MLTLKIKEPEFTPEDYTSLCNSLITICPLHYFGCPFPQKKCGGGVTKEMWEELFSEEEPEDTVDA